MTGVGDRCCVGGGVVGVVGSHGWNLSAVAVRVPLSMGDRWRLREGRKAQCRSENRWWEVIPGVGGARSLPGCCGGVRGR